MARRTTGLQYRNMDYDVKFKELCKELFYRQYTKNPSELTEGNIRMDYMNILLGTLLI